MAKKSKLKVSKKIEEFFVFHRGRLIRKPGYRDAYKRWERLLAIEGKLENKVCDNIVDAIQENCYSTTPQAERYFKKLEQIKLEKRKILKDYNAPFMPNPDDPNDWKLLQSYSRATMKRLEKGEYIVGGWGFFTNKLRKFEVDIWQDNEVIWYEMLEWIDRERRRDWNKSSQNKFWYNIPHLDKTARYFAVFDLRNQKPPVRYCDIALQLANLYKNKNLKQIIDSARHDYRKAFEIIYGVRYKEYDKNKLKHVDIKPCPKCLKFKDCKELCAEAEYFAGQDEVKQQHRIGRSKDAREWAIKSEEGKMV